MARKNYPVEALVDLVNGICKESAPDAAEFRQGAMIVLERVLHESGNYCGFRSLLEGQCEGNPGVRYLNGLPHPDLTLRFKDTDKTRVQYFKK